MRLGEPVDGFRTAYDDHVEGSAGSVLALHGWPGDRQDFRSVVPLLAGRCRVVTPDLRGFGDTLGPPGAEPAQYAAGGQARSVIALIERLALGRVVLAGYDVGSRVAQQVAALRPDLVEALVVSPPLPGAGARVLSPEAQPQFWYQAFHQLELATQLIDGSRHAVRVYLDHFWTHWSGPGFVLDTAQLDRLTDGYARPGSFVASINWYRSGSAMVARSVAERAPEPSARLTTLTTALWPEHDPLFPRAWSDRVGEFFTDIEVRPIDGAGHFTPLEAPEEFAAAILERLR